MEGNKPVKKFKVGAITASAWLNQNGNGGSWYSVTIDRSYSGENGTTQSTGSFRRNDLPLVEKAAALAFAWIHDQAEQTRTAAAAQDAVTV